MGETAVQGALVEVYSVGLRDETRIGEAMTDECGRFRVAYDVAAFRRTGRKTIDLRVKASHREMEVEPFVSSVIYRARGSESITIHFVPLKPQGTEWERVESALEELLNGEEPTGLTEEEAVYASGASGIPIERVLNWRAAHVLSRGDNGEVAAQAYYGLLRQGLPVEGESLAAIDPAELEAAFVKAETLGQISPQVKGEREANLRQLQEIGRRKTRQENGIAASARLPLPAEAVPDSLNESLARLIGRQPLPPMEEAETNVRAEKRAAISSESAAASPKDIPQPQEEWLRRERNLFPELDMDSALEEARRSGRFHNPLRERLARFFEQSPDFDLGSTVVDEYVGNGAGSLHKSEAEQETAALVSRLKAWQRAYQISPRPERMQELLANGLESALDVVSLGEQAFVKLLGPSLGGDDEAKAVYAQADQVHATTVQLYVSAYQSMHDITPAALGGSALNEQLRKALPDWAALFGRLELCDCAECKSVYSAAAYYVDLLQLLNPKTLLPGMTERPLDALRRHRRDLEHLKLTCENTNTLVPYIDLVNEALESYIVHGYPIANNTDAGSAAEDLSVNREYSDSFPESITNAAATAVKHAVFPLSLPFDRALHSTGAYLERLGTDLHELKSAFPDGHPAYALAGDYLGLSSMERNIWMGRLERQLWEFYGYSSATVSTNGLWGEYYSNQDLSGAPVLTRIDGPITQTWHHEPPAPTVPKKFSVRWTGAIVPKRSGAMKLHFDGMSGGYRLWFNGALLFDRWNVVNPEVGVTQPIPMQAGQSYSLRIEYRCGGGSGEWTHLAWTPAEGNTIEAIPAEELRTLQPWHQHLSNVAEFLKRAEISYDELLELLGSKYLNANPAVPNVWIMAQSDPGELEYSWLQNVSFDNYAPLRDIHRFLRLRRKLGWSVRELDKALSALGRERESFLVELADMKRLHRALGQSRTTEAELYSLWSTLDTDGDDSLYARLFQNKALSNPPDADFALLSGGKEIRGHALPLQAKKSQLLAVLRWKENDLQAVLEATGLAGPNTKLTLANLSVLHRYALLGRLLSLAIPELIALLRMTDTPAFRSPADTLAVVALNKELLEAGSRIGELSYLLGDRELQNQLMAPTDLAVGQLMSALADGYRRIRESAAGGQEAEAALVRVFAIQSLAGALGLSDEAVSGLLERLLRCSDANNPGAPMIRDFLTLDPVSLPISYRKLHKAAHLIKSLELEPEELQYFHDNSVHFGGLDFNALPAGEQPSAAELRALFGQWRLLAQYKQLKGLLRPGAPGWLKLFAEAGKPEASPEKLIGLLSELTGWDSTELAVIVGESGWKLTPASFVNPSRIPSLRNVLQLSERIGIPAAKWLGWTKELPDAAMAREVKNAAKSRFDEQAWRQIAAVAEDGLREKWRDALVDYVLQMQPIKANGIGNGNQLFEYFLIDVEMNAAMKTSRIKQAISSVQLFVQRCLLNLEPGISPGSINTDMWEWMKSYRVWEANRKIFLYPENWLEPELRDDKTPFFEQLEQDLLQCEVNDGNLAQAFGRYLTQLDEVSRLDIRALHREGQDMHVFARTYSVPHAYYHRIRSKEGWTPWSKIDADIQGDHLVPYSFNSSLYLFWSQFEKSAEQKDNRPTGSQPGASQERMSVKLAWSEFRDSRWSGKRVSAESLFLQMLTPTDTLEQARKLYHIHVQRLSTGEDLAIEIRYKPEPQGNDGFQTWIYGRLIYNASRKSTKVLNRSSAERAIVVAPDNMERTDTMFQAEQDALLAIPYGRDTRRFGPKIKLMEQTKGTTRFVVPSERRDFSFYQDERTLAYVHQDYYRTYYAEEPEGAATKTMQYEMLFHPLVRDFIRLYNARGVKGLLSLDAQRLTNELGYPRIFHQTYSPTSNLWGSPEENVDFRVMSAYGIYNWEMFLHIPLLLADRLCKERRFEEALKWYHYVFNPTIDSSEPAPAKYWRFLPFFQNTEENRIWRLLTALADPSGDPDVKKELQEEIAAWRVHPFEPHRIARMRIASYQKSVVMKYIDTLVAWGDDLFARDTIESINEATQLYVTAANLLGARPQRIPEMTKAADQSYAQLRQVGLDDFSNALVTVQNRFPSVKVQPSIGPNGAPLGAGVGRSLYFGIPKNDKLLAYWDKVEDRLRKIRNGLNLEGVSRRLALFEAPIDPAAAVSAVRGGAGAGSVLADTLQPLGSYRFAAVLPKALELCGEVRALGSALLSALEKKDAEELGSLRARHESSLYRLIRQVRSSQIEEAINAIEGLQKSRAAVEHRRKHYAGLLAGGFNTFENLQLLGMGASALLQGVAGGSELLSSAGHALPDATLGAAGISSPLAAAQYGGSNAGRSANSFGQAMKTLASIVDTGAAMSGIVGGYKRREAEWKLQEELASRELAQIDTSIAGAELRKGTAEREMAGLELQLAQADETEQYLRGKFTNRELYQWMGAQLSTLYFQTYQLAYNIAKRAEMAYRFERGTVNSGFIQFGYWEGLRKGLLAGERLHLDLKRLETAYYEQNSRDYEITKSISLAQLDPIALIALKHTGTCSIALPEELFDMDYPGQYMRRIKTVSVSVPCVTGPYTGVQGRLTLLSSRIRASASAAAPYKRQPDDARFLHDFSAVQSIAFSHAQNDSGLFELSFRDERYLPFEGAGAISDWKLELPRETNAFDLDTISDIVIRISYTAREGGDALRSAAFKSAVLEAAETQGTTASPALALPGQPNLRRLFSLRHEYSSQWHQFLSPPGSAAGQSLSLMLEAARFPYRYRGRVLTINRVKAYLKLKEGTAYPGQGSPLELKLTPPGGGDGVAAELVSNAAILHGMPFADFELSSEGKGYGEWLLSAEEAAIAALPDALKTTINGRTRLNADRIEDILVLCEYGIV